ncbi:cytochrome b ascorbate-dependent protein 3-like isoform X2 [Limulus polyphemus]|uniref:Cytochrome b ascorbate-dependent protein 3-like isoform X2 n=1 Tax=Limulus polyphemus TaxID=6850 RepID=A0ABM1TR28_LIMPO|nr:cytochrome b ascorbate-dependent protein 3-like isoform X2 [Limulus polyphemus]
MKNTVMGRNMVSKNSAYEEKVSIMVKCGFALWTFIAEVLLFGVLGLCLFWIFYYGGGVTWTNDVTKQFNLHYVLMIGGFIFFNGQAILAYRCLSCYKKIYTKVIHTSFFVFGMSSITVGLVSAIQGHNGAQDPKHFYSLHSWIGLATIGMFALQFLVGFMSFLVFLCCDNATVKLRQRLLPTHITFGLIIFGMAIATCLTGLMQTARHMLSGTIDKQNYEDLPEQTLVINILAVSLLALGIVIIYLVRNNSFKRSATLIIN